MKIHEYQAKVLLREFGVAVPRGEVADNPAQAREIAQRLGGTVVVKAQVHAGGRGKAGGIKVADNAAAAPAAAAVSAHSPLGTATPNSRSSALAWYSWIFTRDGSQDELHRA